MARLQTDPIGGGPPVVISPFKLDGGSVQNGMHTADDAPADDVDDAAPAAQESQALLTELFGPEDTIITEAALEEVRHTVTCAPDMMLNLMPVYRNRCILLLPKPMDLSRPLDQKLTKSTLVLLRYLWFGNAVGSENGAQSIAV